MTKQQAIDYLENNTKDKNACEIAVNAIRMQIGQKPRFHNYQYLIQCASCGAISKLNTAIYYCPKCGCKVDWR